MSLDWESKKQTARNLAKQYHLTLLSASESLFEFGIAPSAATLDPQELEFILETPCKVIRLEHFDSLPEVQTPKTAFHQTIPVQEFSTDKQDLTDSSVISLIDDVISDAIHAGASDIHFEPYETRFRIRFRLDGVLAEQRTLALVQRSAVISRLKVMAGLDIAEKRRPQDGRIAMTDGHRHIDLRVSTLPTHFGEKVVLRILDKSGTIFDLEKLGFSNADLKLVNTVINLPFGLLLVTGPTGSGKSTTLYSILQSLNNSQENIVTIEDPIEYDLPGINQAQARADLGFGFASALRSFLRQDPDIIMVGEIRDRETADMAIRAALTGHLVLSTLHTNDAPGAVVRLVDMGIDPFLIAASVKLVIAQRLVRRLCPRCKSSLDPPFDHSFLHPAEQKRLESASCLFVENGCPACRETGFKGRCGLFELFHIDKETAEQIHHGIGLNELRRYAKQKGLKTLREQGLSEVIRGTTSLSEVIRETAV
jgi:type IV pilus assembly protein PilB